MASQAAAMAGTGLVALGNSSSNYNTSAPLLAGNESSSDGYEVAFWVTLTLLFLLLVALVVYK